MAYVVGLVVLVLGLLVSIALHELGHMAPAKRFGVRVSHYMVGFGPTLWSRTRGETEYGLKAFPLGGYVRLVGMFPTAEAVGADAAPRRGRVAELVRDVRQASAEEIRPGEEHRAFYRLSAPKRVVVMLGGPLMNLLVAVVLIGVILVGFGVPGGASTTVAVVGPCVQPLDAPAGTACTAEDPPTPAAEAGLEPGDRFLSYGGVPIETWADFQAAVRDVPGTRIPLVVERDGEPVTLHVSPITTERPQYDEDGAPVLDADGEPVTAPTRFVGVSPAAETVRRPVTEVPPLVGEVVWETGKAIATLPVRLVDVTRAASGQDERDATGVIGPVGIGRFAGQIASAEGADVSDRVAGILWLLASLNVALFVFNLVPLPPLDGGHVVGAIWDGTKRQWARLRGRPAPRPADLARMMPLAYGVFLALIGMFAVLVWADIVAPVTL